MLQSFGNDAGFILEISVQRTGQKCLSDLIVEPVLAKFPQTARVLSQIQFTD